MARVARLSYKNLMEFNEDETPDKKTKISDQSPAGVDFGAFLVTSVQQTNPTRRPSQKPTQWRSASAAVIRRRNTTDVNLRKLSLYFGKDVPTSMWWRYKLDAVSEKKVPVPAPPKFVQTYQTEPRVAFNCSVVDRIIHDTLHTHLDGEKYDPHTAGGLVKTLTNVIQYRVKAEKFERYRLIVQVYLGHPRDQHLLISSAFLIDSERDRFSRANFCSPNIFAVCVVFGVYLD
ncbi:uncharacterized protein LOC117119370 [Anneissia japonica]|uniref:uncharacterized protein LOC117119370 n=1 Tax=Anneissia japonica TaxID=1529436 RepID=UPI0014259DB5|nr:uncharacterized protein LOC117119370 [Anneissia japonica]